ncbi:MAG TPA: ABC transporter ATP-binding protein [Desulfobacterales bacterium]|nr:ABC transporter ATP-binding protein [Desulfobacterales bacterium]
MDALLRVEGLRKRFAGFAAVDGVSFTVARGEIFGFLGPNGAGKTTTIRMLAGLLQPDGGRIWINGRSLTDEPLACKRATGYIPDRPFLYEKLTGREFLVFIAGLYGLANAPFAERTARLLELFDLTDWQDHLIEGYSHGMRQKLIMTSAFMLAPPLIVVDEPMVGLDPKSARIVKELFRNHARGGGAVFLSTHSLEIAEELCDRIGIIQQGRLVALGDLGSLRERAGRPGSRLEEIFLELTGAWELQAVIAGLRRPADGSAGGEEQRQAPGREARPGQDDGKEG